MRRTLAPLALSLLAACGGGISAPNPPVCDVAHQTGCGAGQYCEPVAGGVGCFAPVLVSGAVTDPVAVTSVAGARVVALDANRAPVSSVAVSGALGGYQLAVRAARDASGRPSSAVVTLRADAQGYETFPGGIRPALPIDLSTATLAGGRWVVSGPLTAIELLPRAGGAFAAVHGTVARPPSGLAPLVVAEPVAGGPGTTAIADLDGSFTIFNLAPDASYAVTAYAQGVNYAGAVTGLLDPGTSTTVGPLAVTGAATASIAGNLIFNNGANPPIQVTLVLESTYLTTLDRGESPPGLTVNVGPGAGGYGFSGVPNGTFRVLAAFGHDGNVRDVSGGGNTESPRVRIAGGVLQGTPPGFKIIPAVDLQQIGGVPVGVDPIAVVATATPQLRWARTSVDSSSKTYRVLVFDVFGNTVWSSDVTSDAPLTYAGPALTAGRPYQLRVLALAQTPAELLAAPTVVTQDSQTEDVVGVFMVRP